MVTFQVAMAVIIKYGDNIPRSYTQAIKSIRQPMDALIQGLIRIAILVVVDDSPLR
jgi:uncharacterized alkaline shock family protein YloU